jgi:AbrB family looped-hinge helix DNA binding protein
MSKVTSKLQVTIPKALANQYGIEPGDEIDWLPAGDTVRLVLAGRDIPEVDLKERLRRFDEATARLKARAGRVRKQTGSEERGWTREELYDRGRAG